MKKALEVINLTFSYNKTQLLEDISFSVVEGQCLGISGSNGSGKSTLLHIIMGFQKYKKGSITFFGKKLSEKTTRIGFVPQNFHFDHSFPITVKEVVSLGKLKTLRLFRGLSKQDKDEVLEAMEATKVADLQDRCFGSLSGGEAQRVLMARALVDRPSIVFLDEPTVGVDRQSHDMILNTLKNLSGSVTVILVSHDKEDLDYLADKNLILDKKTFKVCSTCSSGCC